MEEIRGKDTLVSLEYLEYKLLSEVKKDTVNKSKQGIEKKNTWIYKTFEENH